MSRIGKKPIKIPEGLKIEISESEVKIKGPKGELSQKIHPEIKIETKDGEVFVLPKNNQFTKKGRGLWGLYRALLANMVEGCSKGFEKKLEIEGVGFKAAVEGDNLILNLGFVNPVKIKKPEDISFLVEKNVVTVSGIDKQKVGEMAAIIRKAKKVEPYKGKGIRYQGEKVRRKEGKKVVASK
ncbi:MAG: 50S ribosomal protein L6 [Candidatus Staskawiczbacteria bacterium RIFOXYC1_FULL_37_43]|nr:MAG: 50S ribosomal protein L6 [Candidatus Staskawiczbacteria bacterium RIFCSPHIGHO2_01_FULL_37_17]OGZ72025.1 MAG: 50S ribosomal protein L6 [Candidatus Staskawiczbacteria bacterium RIFCSPLOWO2_01_FULL_37_19]OGZ75809.1 MAG: 50S ribosomal protein L6 [Candidatus Staskawiczbacteria bacterium RIFOXYA1_FULL_37_15]OGZ76770.1 MAG: 50S ribosomal protein L6 [Candidatus Staskawiczbacteria bacterium RIFOXYA12_FULL_37_10]OGZ80699.1 MAG: 50S ribosomal protein L6 [Candidatus Staskawiczbacteria bacterium RIF